MEQQPIFDNLLQKIEANKQAKEQGKVTSILYPFPRMSEQFPGWERGHYYCITAATSVGKTKLAKFLSVTSVYNFVKEHPEIKAKVLYFALEESIEEFWLSMISTLLYTKYEITLTLAQLKSLGSYTLSNFELDKIKECQAIIDDMTQYIEVIDHLYNPFGIYKYVHDWHLAHGREDFDTVSAEKVSKTYIPDDPDQWVFVVVDHMSLLTPEAEDKGSLYSAMGRFSKHYCLKHFVKKLNCVTIMIQQQDMTNDKQEYYQGQSIDEKLEPSIPGLANCKETARDYHFIMGLFSPARYGMSSHRKYNIKVLGERYMSLKILKDRHYGLTNRQLALHFNGATNTFKELPRVDEIDYSKY